MIILTLRTDKPEAEIGLYDDDKRIAYEAWQAHRQLAETLHSKIKQLLTSNDKQWADIKSIVVFEGPGSFTGLRIGITVANTLAYANSVPIVGGQGEDWIKSGIEKIQTGAAGSQVMPFYGSDPHITVSRK